MKRLALTVLLFLGLSFSPAPARADYKIATVDVNKILNESSEAKEKRKEFEAKAAEARKKLDAKKASLVALQQKLKDSKVDDNSKEAESFRAQARDFEHMVHDSDDDLKKEFLKVNKVLTDKALKLVSDYATAHKIDLVLDSGDRSRTSALLFGDPTLDITGEIIKTMAK
jgi:Skp family chaperone for outer membrane proteins